MHINKQQDFSVNSDASSMETSSISSCEDEEQISASEHEAEECQPTTTTGGVTGTVGATDTDTGTSTRADTLDTTTGTDNPVDTSTDTVVHTGTGTGYTGVDKVQASGVTVNMWLLVNFAPAQRKRKLYLGCVEKVMPVAESDTDINSNCVLEFEGVFTPKARQ